VNHSRAQQTRGRNGKIENGGLDANLRLAAVNNEFDFVAEEFLDVGGISGRKLIGGIRARRGQGEIAFSDYGLDEGMARPADPDGGTPGGDDVWDFGRAREDERKWASPKSSGKVISK